MDIELPNVDLLEAVSAESTVGGRSESKPKFSRLAEEGADETGTDGEGVPMALVMRPMLASTAPKPCVWT